MYLIEKAKSIISQPKISAWFYIEKKIDDTDSLMIDIHITKNPSKRIKNCWIKLSIKKSLFSSFTDSLTPFHGGPVMWVIPPVFVCLQWLTVPEQTRLGSTPVTLLAEVLRSDNSTQHDLKRRWEILTLAARTSRRLWLCAYGAWHWEARLCLYCEA